MNATRIIRADTSFYSSSFPLFKANISKVYSSGEAGRRDAALDEQVGRRRWRFDLFMPPPPSHGSNSTRLCFWLIHARFADVGITVCHSTVNSGQTDKHTHGDTDVILEQLLGKHVAPANEYKKRE